MGHGRAGHRQVGQTGRRGDDADRDGLPAAGHDVFGRARPRLRAAGRHRQGVYAVDARPTLTRRCPHRPSRSRLPSATASRRATSTRARTRTWVRNKVRFHIVILLVLGAASGTGLGAAMLVVLDHDRVGHDRQIRVPEEGHDGLEDDSKSERHEALVHELDRKPDRRAVLPRA